MGRLTLASVGLSKWVGCHLTGMVLPSPGSPARPASDLALSLVPWAASGPFPCVALGLGASC